LQPNNLFLSYNIQFVYKYHKIDKQEKFCMISMLPLHRAFRPVSCSFLNKFVQSLQSLTFTHKFLTKFFCSITFKNIQIFHQNSIFVAETHVYTKSLT